MYEPVVPPQTTRAQGSSVGSTTISRFIRRRKPGTAMTRVERVITGCLAIFVLVAATTTVRGFMVPGDAYQASEASNILDSDVIALLMVFTLFAYVFIENQSTKRKRHFQELPSHEGSDGTKALRQMIHAKRDGLLDSMSKDVRRILDSSIQVGHVMSKQPRVVEPECLADEIRNFMMRTNAHHTLVCNGQKLIGVISDRDLHRNDARLAIDLMTRRPICVSPDTLLIPAVTTMINKRISCLPVTDGNRLVGVLTRTDLLIAFQCMLHILSQVLADGAPGANKKPPRRVPQ